ncbi:MAG: hypothetical protein WA705_02805 [Candidatus Ozemobacteraceae bacterium]
MNLRWVEKPVVEVLQNVVASSGGVNLVCSPFCSGTISLFCYGQDLYHEEIVNLIAKTKDFAVRRIGNALVVADPRIYQDTFDRSFYRTTRLQNTQAGQTWTLLKNLFSHFGASPFVRLSFDTLNNEVFVGGKSRLIGSTKELLDILDKPLPRLTLTIHWSHGKSILRETLTAPLGKPLLREIQTKNGTTTIELLPILFGESGNIGLRWSLKQTDLSNPIFFSGWTLLPQQAEPKLLDIQASESTSLSVFGVVSWVPPVDSPWEFQTPPSPPQASGSSFDELFDSSSDSTPDGFDKAFDSSF